MSKMTTGKNIYNAIKGIQKATLKALKVMAAGMSVVLLYLCIILSIVILTAYFPAAVIATFVLTMFWIIGLLALQVKDDIKKNKGNKRNRELNRIRMRIY